MIRDKAVFFGWITGLLMAIVLIWVVAKPIHARYLLMTVNKVLINTEDNRRLKSHLDVPKGKIMGNSRPAASAKALHGSGGRTGLFGYWYTMNDSKDLMFVFAIFQDGILIPCGAVVSAEGKVEEIIPLSAHAGQVFNKIPKSVIQLYVQRIETAPQPAGTETSVLIPRGGSRG